MYEDLFDLIWDTKKGLCRRRAPNVQQVVELGAPRGDDNDRSTWKRDDADDEDHYTDKSDT